MYLSLVSVIVMAELVKTSHLSEMKKKKNFFLKTIVKERNTQFVRFAEPSVITTSTDAWEWKDRSSKRQIDMSSIRRDGRVLSNRKRYIRTYAHTHIRTHAHLPRSHMHVRLRQFCSVRKRTLVIRSCLFCM